MTRVSDLTHITTRKGRQYELVHPPLGQGGQGVVFRCKEDPDLLVKLVVEQDELIVREATDPASKKRAEAMSDGLEEVKLLGLPDTCHIALPQEELLTYVGYSMRMLEDMMPIHALIASPGIELTRFYIDTGGLRRRVKLLHNLAHIIHDLHGRGICYGDLSPSNVYVSTSSAYHETWLIDADNMRMRACDRAFYTPWYGAPEVVSGQRFPDMRSDCYSFALLAWHVLAQVHPFMGALLEEEDDAWDEETVDMVEEEDTREFEIQKGVHPWIHDERSDANHTSAGIPHELVCSKRLMQLFRATFEQGCLEPSKRPSMSRWVDTLQRAMMHLIECPTCKAQYYPTHTCPWCKTGVPSLIQIEARLWIPEFDESASAGEEVEAFQHARVISRLVRELPEDARLLIKAPLTGPDATAPHVELMYHSDFIYIEHKTSLSLQLIKPNGRAITLKRGERFECKRGQQFWLHCGELDVPHRYLTFARH